MKYRRFIEQYFLIDEPLKGELVPFTFNPVQVKYYDELCREYDIEKRGIAAPVREYIVKARREGFSSLILALFCADDILQANATETQVVSYKDDATATFRRRYRRYVLSWYAKKAGASHDDLKDPNALERFAKQAFSVDSSELVLRHNLAHFSCGTASARTGGRGGVLQKLLFSEAAHYPDTEKMTAKEIVEGTMQQVDKASGWIFQESTGNGKGNFFYKTWELAQQGLSRFKARFYGWREFYSADQFAVISSEFTDQDMLRQEYPESAEEAFLSSSLAFTSRDELLGLIGAEQAPKLIHSFVSMQGVNYIDQCELIVATLIAIVQANPNRAFYVGIDSGKDNDKTIATILKSKELTARSGIRGIAIDATGAGDFMPDWFAKNTKWYIHRVKFSRQTKSIMYKNLRTIIQAKLTQTPAFVYGKEFLSDEWRDWYKEMLDLQKQLIGDLLVVAHPGGDYHDDYPDSWALAELVWMVLRGVPDGQKPPDDEGSPTSSAVRRLLASGGRRGSGYRSGIENPT